MDWDPIKKRFFKKLPEKAKVEPRHSPSTQQSHQDAEARFAQRTPLRRSAFAGSSFRPLGFQARLATTAAGICSVTNSSVQQRRRAVMEANLGRMKHVSTLSLNTSGIRETGSTERRQRQTASVNRLHHAPFMGSFLCFSNGCDDLFYLDASPFRSPESCSAISVFLSMRIAPDVESGEISPNAMVDLKTFSNAILHWERKATSLYHLHEKLVAIFYEDNIIVGVLEKSGSQLLRCTAKIGWDSPTRVERIQHLCVRSSPDQSTSPKKGSVILACATQRQVHLVRLHSQTVSTAEAAFQHLHSDIICLEMLSFGGTLFVGLRNGTIMEYNTSNILGEQDTSSADAPPSRRTKPRRKRYSGLHHPALGKGAVTHIKAVSDDEVIVAYTSGEMFLVHPKTISKPLIRYQGHMNSWSFGLPMTVDVEHRLLAVAGQDRKVRVWSLDYPLPLQGTPSTVAGDAKDEELNLADGRLGSKPLQETIFAIPISGLAFCQRRYISNLESDSTSRGLPALAVSCHGNEIAFFE